MITDRPEHSRVIKRIPLLLFKTIQEDQSITE